MKIFAILNLTPDSFSDGGKYASLPLARERVETLLAEGADFIDAGAQSTRPGAEFLSPETEWRRLLPFLEWLKTRPSILAKVSLDTFHPEVAEGFLERGGTLINDVSGFRDERMVKLVSRYGARCLVNHFPGKNPAEVHRQKLNDPNVVKSDLLRQKKLLVEAGVPAERIVLDPGIGFGKTTELNRRLLTGFAGALPDEKVLLGFSRKRFLEEPGKDRFSFEVNRRAGKLAKESGAWGVRVHEVAYGRRSRGKGSAFAL